MRWTPTTGGDYAVRMRVSDEDGGERFQDWTLRVPASVDAGPYSFDEGTRQSVSASCEGCTSYTWDMNDDGVFETSGQSVARDWVDGPATFFVRAQYRAAATDPAAGADPLRWSLVQGPSGMAIGATTGVLNWVPAAGTFSVQIAVTDGDGGRTTQAWTLEVLRADHGGPYSANEGGTVQLTAQCDLCTSLAWDLDDDGTFETAGAQVTFDASSIDGPASRDVNLRACDADNICDVASTRVSVNNVAPDITTDPPLVAATTVQYRYVAAATDVAGVADPLRWRLDQGPGSMAINEVSGVLTWTPAVGTHAVVISVADDEGGRTSQSWSLVVREVDAQGPYSVDEGGSLQLTATCTHCVRFEWDLDGDGDYDDSTVADPTFSAASIDGDASRIVRVRGCEADGYCAPDSATIAIDNVAPTITTSPSSSGTAGSGYEYDPAATDPAGPADSLQWRLVSGPTGMTVAAGTGAVRWDAEAGSHAVTIEVNDGDGGVTRQSWTILVPSPVTVSTGGPYDVDEGADVELAAPCIGGCTTWAWDLDDDGDYDDSTAQRPTFSAAAYDGPATRTVRVRGCDGGGNCSVATGSVDVNNVAPTVTSTPLLTSSHGDNYVYVAAATDPAAGADPFVWRKISGPGSLTIGTVNGRVTWSAVAGRHPVEIEVHDGDQGRTRQAWTIDVPPAVVSTSITFLDHPVRARMVLVSDVVSTWTVDVMRFNGAGCEQVIFERRTMAGVNRFDHAFDGVSPGARYCYRATVESGGASQEYDGTFDVPALATFVTGPTTSLNGLDIDVAATFDEEVVATVEWSRGECASVPSGLAFDGDYVLTIKGTGTTWSSELTFEAWIQLPVPSGAQTAAVFGTPDGTIRMDLVGGAVRASVTTDRVYEVTSSVPAPTGAWTHVAMTIVRDGRLRVFIDGLNRGEIPIAGGPITTTSTELSWGATTGSFVGGLASMAGYVRELGTTELQDHATAGVGQELGDAPGVVAALPLDEATLSQMAYDGSNHFMAALLGESAAIEGSDPSRIPEYTDSQGLGTGDDLETTLTGLASGTYCYRVIADGTRGWIASEPTELSPNEDVTAPTVIAPPTTIAECTESESAALSLNLPTVTDDFDPDPAVVATVGGQTIVFPRYFDLGSTVVQWRATDDAGNVGIANETVRVVDTIMPTATGGPVDVVEATSPAGTPHAPLPATSFDTCSAVSVTDDGPALYPLGNTAVELTVSDSSGNEVVVNRVVRVVDTTPPSFDPALAPLFVGHNDSTCMLFNPPRPQVVDNASLPEAIDVQWVRLAGPGAPDCWHRGNHQLLWTITDEAGNEATGTQTFILGDPVVRVRQLRVLVGGNTVSPGYYHDEAVTLEFEITGGVSPYQLTLFPAPVSISNNGAVYHATYEEPGDYSQVLVLARDGNGAGQNIGVGVLGGFGIDLAPPQVDMGALSQAGVVPGDPSTYPVLYLGESISLERLDVRDSEAETVGLGQALRFMGDDRVVIPAPVLFAGNTAEELSVELWVRPEINSSGTLIELPGRSNDAALRVVLDNNGVVSIDSVPDGVNTNVRGRSVQGRRWSHVVVTYDGRVIRVWQDGRPAGYRAAVGDVEFGARDMLLGSGLTGDLAEVVVWSEALDEDEILDRFSGGVAQRAADPRVVAHYPFDGNDQLVLDRSGNGNDGVLGSAANLDASDPERLVLRHPVDPTASGIVQVSVSLMNELVMSRDALVLAASQVASGAPLARGARSVGGLVCVPSVSGPCTPSERVLRASLVANWAGTSNAQLTLAVYSRDAAGNEHTEMVRFVTRDYPTALQDAVDAAEALIADPLNSGASAELEDAQRSFVAAHTYATLSPPYLEGSYLRADQALNQLRDAEDVGVDLGSAMARAARALSAHIRRSIRALEPNVEEADMPLLKDGLRYTEDARFETAMFDHQQASALARVADQTVALLSPPFQPSRRQQKAAHGLWADTLDDIAAQSVDPGVGRTRTSRLAAVQRSIAITRDMLQEVIFPELQAALSTPLTTERRTLEQLIDLLDRESDDPSEVGDLIGITNDAVTQACLDRLAVLQLSDRDFTLCYLALNDLARFMDGVSEPLVPTTRWRAALAIALFNMLDLSLFTSPTALPWVAGSATPPDVDLVLPDAVAATVPGALSASAADPSGTAQRAFEQYEQAKALLESGDVDGAYAVFIDERCTILDVYNRFYSNLAGHSTFADPAESPIDGTTVGCQ